MEKHLSWKETVFVTEKLARKIASDFLPDVVIAVSSGGLVPGKLLKEMLGVKSFAVISSRGYDGKVKRAKTVVEKNISGFIPKNVRQKVLVVDDIADSGETFVEVLKQLKKIDANGKWQVKTASLLLKPRSVFTPDFYVLENTGWVVFPWDTGVFDFT